METRNGKQHCQMRFSKHIPTPFFSFFWAICLEHFTVLPSDFDIVQSLKCYSMTDSVRRSVTIGLHPIQYERAPLRVRC